MDTGSLAIGGWGVRDVPVLVWVTGAAACYTAAMVAMKLWGGAPGVMLGGVIAIAIIMAVVMEIAALREARLGMIYVAILGAECVMMALVCHYGFGETLSTREITGAGFIVFGTALAWL